MASASCQPARRVMSFMSALTRRKSRLANFSTCHQLDDEIVFIRIVNLFIFYVSMLRVCVCVCVCDCGEYDTLKSVAACKCARLTTSAER